MKAINLMQVSVPLQSEFSSFSQLEMEVAIQQAETEVNLFVLVIILSFFASLFLFMYMLYIILKVKFNRSDKNSQKTYWHQKVDHPKFKKQ